MVITSDGHSDGGEPYTNEELEIINADEPDTDDIVTSDHQNWYTYGKLYFVGDEAGLKKKMKIDHWYPSVWFISDHGNAHRIEI